MYIIIYFFSLSREALSGLQDSISDKWLSHNCGLPRYTSVKNKLNLSFLRWFQIGLYQSKGFPLLDIDRKHWCSFFNQSDEAIWV